MYPKQTTDLANELQVLVVLLIIWKLDSRSQMKQFDDYSLM